MDMDNCKLKNLKGFKQKLPIKICKTCNKPFQWRKKWSKNWDEINYCSKKCKAKKIISQQS